MNLADIAFLQRIQLSDTALDPYRASKCDGYTGILVTHIVSTYFYSVRFGGTRWEHHRTSFGFGPGPRNSMPPSCTTGMSMALNPVCTCTVGFDWRRVGFPILKTLVWLSSKHFQVDIRVTALRLVWCNILASSTLGIETPILV